jgi:hypothetical protein
MSVTTASCPNCRATLTPSARFCAACGSRVGQQAAQIEWAVADRRTFGVLPGREKLRTARVRTKRRLGVLRARIRLAVETVYARLDAGRDRFHLRRRASRLAHDRKQALQDLGAAVLEDDPQELDRAKARVAEIDGHLDAVRGNLERVDESLQERMAEARRESGSTEAVEPVPERMPEPVPEPAPSDPPGPVVVPEPEPVPHEPPGPVIVPEPQPPESSD